MDEAIRQRIQEAHKALPAELQSTPANEKEIVEFEEEFEPIPEDYRWYLLACGGGAIGAETVDGIEELSGTHRKFKEEEWTMTGVFVIGWDGSGNPFGIETTTGRVLVEDHDYGGIHEIAPSFEALLTKGLISDD